MAFNKLDHHSCGPKEQMKTVDADQKTYCRNEAKAIVAKGAKDFLFTPNEAGGLLNGIVVDFPRISQLFRTFIPNGHSLVFSFKDETEFVLFIEDILEKKHSAYSDLLLRYSVRTIPTQNTHYQFSGGSFARVNLSLVDNQRWEVSKMVTKGIGDVDADQRLLAEGKFIRDLPPRAAPLFPRVHGVTELPTEVGYQMAYCPFPTMAELVLSRQITPEQTVDFLTGIYETMFSKVYSKDDPNNKDDNYFNRIDRRRERIFATPKGVGERLKRLLSAEHLIIDGKEYHGFNKLFESVKQDEHYRRLAIPPDHSVCHGDMVLEDILFQPYTGEFKLIDPNGRSHSRYYDIAKTLLSLATKYELFYFDRFSLEYDPHDETDIHIHFDDPQMAEAYDRMGELFWEFLRKNASQFFKNEPEWQDRLKLLNALQNLAIVMFHIVRHNKEERAIAFLLMGIKKISSFLNLQV